MQVEIATSTSQDSTMPARSLKCPSCESGDIARSRRKFYEKPLFWLKPYRCHACLRRFLLIVSL
jgi:transposase-like protein